MPTTYPPIYPPGNTNGGSQGQGNSSNYIGAYTNLPQGINNAGGGANNAYVRTVQPGEYTSNRLNGLLASNSPYMDQARRSGLNTANDRGLLNSSIAAGNSMSAAIAAGMPIAQADAGADITAAGQNLDALNSILANSQNNRTSQLNANTAAGASMYNADLDYRLGMNNLGFQGDQAGLNRGFQDYMQQQQFNQGLRTRAFDLGSNLLQGDQSFTHNAYLQGMNNPFAMSDPEAFQGYLDWANNGNDGYYDDLWGFATNAGQPTPGWEENSQWYSSPSQYAPQPQFIGGGR